MSKFLSAVMTWCKKKLDYACLESVSEDGKNPLELRLLDGDATGPPRREYRGSAAGACPRNCLGAVHARHLAGGEDNRGVAGPVLGEDRGEPRGQTRRHGVEVWVARV